MLLQKSIKSMKVPTMLNKVMECFKYEIIFS